jgi:hypothetical protein
MHTFFNIQATELYIILLYWFNVHIIYILYIDCIYH